MISLGIRKVVDTSDWDQSFVDGQGTSLSGINLKRSSSGDRVISGSTPSATSLRPTWNRKDIEEQELTNWQEAEVSAYDDGKAVPLESFPAERSSRHVNPFLDSGLSRESQSKAYHLVERKSGIALNYNGTRGNGELRHGEHEFNISVRDLDTRGRKTLPVGEVTAWLDSLKLFEASRLRLNRSTSSSPPLLCDHDLLALQERTKLNGGISPYDAEAPVFEGHTPGVEGRPSGVNLKSPVIEGRSSVFDDRPVLSGTPVFEGWTAGASEGRTPALDGRTPSFEGRSPAFEGRSPAFEGRTPTFEGRSPAFKGRTPTFEGRSPAFEGQTPTFEGRSPAFEGRTPSFEGRTPVFEVRSPTFEGRTPTFEWRAPSFEGRTPAFEGRTPSFEVRSPSVEGRAPILNGRFPIFDGLSPTSNGRPQAPVISCATPLDVGPSDQAAAGAGTEVPVAYSRAVSFLPAWDLERLETVYRRLDACGFYFGRMTMDEARLRLTGYPVGTFLLRDSSDRRFLFSLSIQTRRGTTSIRVLYEGGLFRLDSDPDQSHLMPTFDCVLNLIRHYVRLSAGRRLASLESPPANSYVLREATGRRDTPVLLRRPLETTPASLAHACRKSIHHRLGNHPQNVSRLHLKPSLKDYLSLYPYDI